MDDVKKCSKCKTIYSKCNFNKDVSTRDGLNPICKVCRLRYYNEKREQRIEYSKLYAKQHRVKTNLYERNKRKTNLNFKLACNIRSRTNQVFKSQNVKTLNSTIDLIGCSLDFLKKWILHQLYGEMTLENYGNIWCLDHGYPISKINLPNRNDMYKFTNWINLRPMYIKDKIVKGDKIDHQLYLMQEVKAKYFMKLNV